MLITILFILSAFLQINPCHGRRKLPVFLRPCKHDENLSDCARNVLEKLRPHLVKGVREFEIPSIDPMLIPVTKIERRNSNIAEYSATMTKSLLFGCKYFNILEHVINLDTLTFRLKLEIPYLYLETQGLLDGSVLGFQVHGSGEALLNYTRVVLDIVLNGDQYNYKEKEFINWKIEDLEINYDSCYFMQLQGFLEDPAITELLRLAANRSSRLLVATFRSTIEHSIGRFIIDSINRVHKIYPKDILYPA